MMWTKPGILLMVVMSVTACASGGSAGSRSASSSVITEEELATASELNAYEVVQRLRPQWLTTRGPATFSGQQGIRVYVDGISRGFVTELASLRAVSVKSMRYLTGREATARFGTDHGDGAILVTMR